MVAREPAGAERRSSSQATKLPEPVIARQLERTELTHPHIEAGCSRHDRGGRPALQEAGVIRPDRRPRRNDRSRPQFAGGARRTAATGADGLHPRRAAPSATGRQLGGFPLRGAAWARASVGASCLGCSARPPAARAGAPVGGRRAASARAGPAGAPAEPVCAHSTRPRGVGRPDAHVGATLRVGGLRLRGAAGILVGALSGTRPLAACSTRRCRRCGRSRRSPGCPCSSSGSASSRPRRWR